MGLQGGDARVGNADAVALGAGGEVWVALEDAVGDAVFAEPVGEDEAGEAGAYYEDWEG